MKFVLAVVLLGMLQTCLAERNARLFFATISSSTSTSTSTTTLTTTSICFTTSTGGTACKGRKKRRAEIMKANFEVDEFGPSRVDRSEQLIPSEENQSYRDARLFLLSTSTSTVTAMQSKHAIKKSIKCIQL
jgi:hypothetical protein